MITGMVGSSAAHPVEHVEAVDLLHAQVGEHHVRQRAARRPRAPRCRRRPAPPRSPRRRAGRRAAAPSRRGRRRPGRARSGRAASLMALLVAAAADARPEQRHLRAAPGLALELDLAAVVADDLRRRCVRPRPVPWPRFLVVKKGSKTWCAVLLGDAAAVVDDLDAHAAPARRAGRPRAGRGRVTRPPGAQASQAFMTRFTSTCWSWSGSAATAGSVVGHVDARASTLRRSASKRRSSTTVRDDRRHRDRPHRRRLDAGEVEELPDGARSRGRSAR